jgi:hypothetical protein
MENKLWITLYRSFFGVYVPEELRSLKGEVLLHVSDTPSSMYRDLRRLLLLLEPRWFLHTGDLADDIKLGVKPRLLPAYRDHIRKLAKVVSCASRCTTILVTGNHDHEETVREVFPDAVVFPGSGRYVADGLDLNVSHEPGDLQKPYGFLNFFGHTPSRPEGANDEENRFLNGLHAAHVIHMPTGRVFSLPYPGYVNDDRLLRRKRGM